MGKMYCRIYQAVFKIGMYLIPWGMPETLEGAGSVKKLPDLIKKKGYNKVLVVTDKVLMDLGLPKGMLEAMDAAGIEYVVYDGVQPNPTDRNVNEGLKLFRENGCQAMVAFGGGSPMDCCKGIGAMAVKKGKTVEQLQGLFKVLHRIPTIFAVPTTAGTGSETTVAAVITNEKTHHKASMNDTSLMPKYAVLDPELTVGLPPKVTSTTGMDALCHAVECYTNNTYNSKLEKKLAEDAVKLIYDNLYTAYCDGSNLEARQNMQKAAFYAGRAFTRGCVGYVHAIGHTLGGLYGTPHGLAMSVILPHVMRQFGSAAHERLARLAEVCGMTGANDAEKAEKFISWIEEMKAKMDIPAGLDVIKDEDVPQIIAWAMKEANPLYPVPVIWDKADFEKCISTIRNA
ncbi:MAG: iron-containing alcohol dehydrogenase [Anaerovoracaceae bacterium]